MLQFICKVCGGTFDDNRRYDPATGKTGRYPSYCSSKECKKRRKQASRYGASIEHINSLYQKQQGRCAICGLVFTKLDPALADHNHTTGHVRGLLCRGCNMVLGWYERNRARLEKYVEENDLESQPQPEPQPQSEPQPQPQSGE